MAVFAFMTCAACGGGFTGNPFSVPSVDAEARTEAIRIVDQRHGYTIEHAPDPLAHAQEYDEEEAQLFDSRRREPLCEACVQIINDARVERGLEPWEIFNDSYGYAGLGSWG